MKKFKKLIFQLVISVILMNVAFYIVLFSFEKPYIDRFYDKVNAIHDGSIIIGTSRARYGIQETYLNEKYDYKNLGFTVDMSPFDISYTKFIKNVTNYTPKNQNVKSIITVDPYSLSIDNDSINDYLYDYKINDFKHINIKYLLRNKSTPVKITEELVNKFFRELFYGNKDNRKIKEGDIQNLINNYHKPDINGQALNNLSELITYLKNYSEVYLVRLPITKQFYVEENLNSPKFDFLMDSISKSNQIKYYDFNLDSIQTKLDFYDIHHMNTQSSIIFTKHLDSIINRNIYN